MGSYKASCGEHAEAAQYYSTAAKTAEFLGLQVCLSVSNDGLIELIGSVG